MEDCLFCKIIAGEIPSKKLYEDDLVLVIMDAFPNSLGHSLIIPKTHYTDFYEIPNDLLLHIHDVSKKLTPMFMEKLDAKAITFINNYGDAQVIKHYHYHILPEYKQIRDIADNDIEATFKKLTN